MHTYLINFFNYNHESNHKLLAAIKQLSEKDEAIRLFSHLITSQNKWMNRITKKVGDGELNWFGPVFGIDTLGQEWTASCNMWINYISSLSENDLVREVEFLRSYDGKHLAVKIIDIVLQLNYHSIHHRAQINTLISKQGIAVPQTDYIFTALREIYTIRP